MFARSAARARCSAEPLIQTGSRSRSPRQRDRSAEDLNRPLRGCGRASTGDIDRPSNARRGVRCVLSQLERDFQTRARRQASFYLSAVDSLLRAHGDGPTIGLLLSKTKNRVIAECALRDANKLIGVSEYQRVPALPAPLETSLPTIEQIEEPTGATPVTRGGESLAPLCSPEGRARGDNRLDRESRRGARGRPCGSAARPGAATRLNASRRPGHDFAVWSAKKARNRERARLFGAQTLRAAFECQKVIRIAKFSVRS